MEVKMPSMACKKFLCGFLEMTAIHSTWHVKQQMELHIPHGSQDTCRDFFLTPVHFLLRHNEASWNLMPLLITAQD